MYIIKKIEDFNPVNEGFFKSLFSGVGDIFRTKKSKILSIIKEIESIKNEEAYEAIRIEKDIANTPKENTPEYRYTITNLKRQEKILKSMKAVEINKLTSEAEDIIKEDGKLYTLFSSEMARIKKESMEKYLKGVSSYLDRKDLRDLAEEFEKLVKDANYKSRYYEEFGEETEIDYSPELEDNIKEFIDMNPQKTKKFLEELDYNELKKFYSRIKEFQFDLEQILDNKISSIRSKIRKAEKEGNEGAVSVFKRNEALVKYEYKEYINSIRNKVILIEKEMKNKRYVTNN